MKSYTFKPGDILLPKEADMARWSVVACDQYTAQPEYWDEAERLMNGSPSTLRLMLPEAWIGAEKGRSWAESINGAMRGYLSQGLFREIKDSFIYIERTLASGKIRRGMLGLLDLEAYDYARGSALPVRATEGTVESRLPIRVGVRRSAPLEMPHVMVLTDNADIIAKPEGGAEKLYDFDLMLGGGHIAGWRAHGKDAERVEDAVSGTMNAGSGIFAVGDGNHSLAAAKLYWNELKKTLAEDERENSPARFALAEMVSVYDGAVDIEPIHRVIFGTDTRAFMEAAAAFWASLPQGGGEKREVLCVSGEGGGGGLLRAVCRGARRNAGLYPRRRYRAAYGKERRQRRNAPPADRKSGYIRNGTQKRDIPQKELFDRRGARQEVLSGVQENKITKFKTPPAGAGGVFLLLPLRIFGGGTCIGCPQRRSSMEDFNSVAALLPKELKAAALALPFNVRSEAEEVRLRAGRPPSVLLPDGELSFRAEKKVEREELTAVLERATGASFHTAQAAIASGYFTVRGGCRIGICGTAVMSGCDVGSLREISSLAIRVEREIKNCSDGIFSELTQNSFTDTLILSPPGHGKTTLLRDLVRRLSDGGLKVSLADERSEVSGMFEGVPAFDIGRCTDVLTGAPKAKAAMMLLRSMSPQVLALDEITAPEDVQAIAAASGCGVRLLATAHSASVQELRERRLYRDLLSEGIFKRAVVIERHGETRRYEVIRI